MDILSSSLVSGLSQTSSLHSLSTSLVPSVDDVGLFMLQSNLTVTRALVRCKFDDKQEYKRYKKTRNKVNHQLEIRKRKYYQSQFLECGNNSAKMWKLINTLTNSQVKTHSYPNKLLKPINSQHRKSRKYG